MIKAKKERAGTDTLLRGFVCEISAGDMLIVNKALRMLRRDPDTHPDDKRRIGQMLKSIEDAVKGD